MSAPADPSTRAPQVFADDQDTARVDTHAADAALPLALAIHRQGLGYELTSPLAIGALRLNALDVSLPGLSFPLDITGGLSRFRHRRGQLERLELEVGYAALERQLAKWWSGLLAAGPPAVRLEAAGDERLRVELSWHPRLATGWLVERAQGGGLRAQGGSALAFEAVFDHEDDELRVHCLQVRGANLPQPPTELLLQALSAVARGARAEQTGCTLHWSAAARSLLLDLLPQAGLRVPDAHAVAWQALRASGDAAWALAERTQRALESHHGARRGELPEGERASARESWALLRDADRLWQQHLGDGHDEARAALLAASERASGHPELLRRLVEIDALHTPARAEAAAQTLHARELGPLGDLPFQIATASQTHDAAHLLQHEASREPSAAVAAELWLARAQHVDDLGEQLRALDLAQALSPAHVGVRALRFVRRLHAGQTDAARADAEHLEAQCKVGAERHALLLAVGRLYALAGQADAALRVLERAQQQKPDDPRALFALGEQLAEVGRAGRAALLMGRALELAEPDPQRAAADTPRGRKAARKRSRARAQELPQAERQSMQVRLARCLGDDLGDVPAALARLAQVDDDGAVGAHARELEARWRRQLGDWPRARMAYVRLRELSRSLLGEPGAPPSDAALRAAAALDEAATFERDTCFDPQQALRHLSAALALTPRSAARQAAYEALLRTLSPLPNAPPAPAPAWSATDAETAYAEAPIAELTAATREPAPAAAAPSEPPDAATPSEPAPSEPPDAATPSEPIAFARPSFDFSIDEPEPDARADDLRQRFMQNPHDVALQSELVEVLEATGRGLELLALLAGMMEDAPSDDERARLEPVRQRVLLSLEESARARGSDGEAELYRMSRTM